MLRLRPYQQKIKQDVYDAWSDGHDNVLLVMPTGAGKTVTFCSIAMDFAVHPKNKTTTAIVVHRKELVQQISLTLSKEGVTHNIIAPKKTILGIIGAQRRVHGKQFYDYSAPISVISVDTLISRIHKHKAWAEQVRFWIVDEAAHVLQGNKWGRAVSYFPNATGLGVTATPQRLDRKGLGSHADGVFDVMVEGPNTRWLIKNNYLSRYKVAVPQGDYERYLKSAGGNSDYTHKAMREASEKSQIVGDVVENYLKFAKDKQAIVFATDITTAKDIEEKFMSRGVPAKLLTGLSDDKERLDGMLDFEEKKINALINVDLFDEGLDVPGIECVIMARPTMSLGKYLQMVGRGLRRAEGKDYLILIDHVGNVTRHGYPDKPRNWTLDAIAKRRKFIDEMRVCVNPMCMAPFERELTHCPWCGTPAITTSRAYSGRTPPEQVDGDLYLIDPMTLAELEESTVLEDPGVIAERVQKAAGGAAAIKAMRNQQARIETQKELSEVIAQWAGETQARTGLDDRQIHKKFFVLFNKTIAQALAEPRADMSKLMDKLKGEMNETKEVV